MNLKRISFYIAITSMFYNYAAQSSSMIFTSKTLDEKENSSSLSDACASTDTVSQQDFDICLHKLVSRSYIFSHYLEEVSYGFCSLCYDKQFTSHGTAVVAVARIKNMLQDHYVTSHTNEMCHRINAQEFIVPKFQELLRRSSTY